MCNFPHQVTIRFFPFVFVGLILLMMHNCISPALMEHMPCSQCRRCDGHYVEDAANSTSLIIFCFTLCLIIIIFTGISKQNTTSKSSTPSSKPLPTYNINCVITVNYPEVHWLNSMIACDLKARQICSWTYLGDLASSIRA